MKALDEIEARASKATPGPWTACRMVHADTGEPMTPEDIGEYVRGCVEMGPRDDFLFLSGEKDDGPADVAHVGNGPTSPENAQFLAHAREDVPRLAKALRLAIDHLEGRADFGVADKTPECGLYLRIREILSTDSSTTGQGGA